MKTCIKCNAPKSEDQFAKGRNACKECRKAYMKGYYAGNPTYFADYREAHREKYCRQGVEINRTRRHERYALIAELKSNPCLDCKKSFPSCVMDFDHRDPTLKVSDVSVMVKNLVPWFKVLEEIAKCDLVCVCCHRLRTYHGENSYRTRRGVQHRKVLDQLKTANPCTDCSGFFAACQMDFDHRGEDQKVANVAQLVSEPTEILLGELGKCDLVCANCHRIRSNTGVRKQGLDLRLPFEEVLRATPLVDDGRSAPFPEPQLLGEISDKSLAELTGVSKPMVGWYRRRAGIKLDRQGNRVSA